MKDPICGMEVTSKKFSSKKNGKEYFFCSKQCKEKFDNKVPFYRSDKFAKVFPKILGLVLITGTLTSIYYNFMVTYMGIFFIVFSLFKMVDWKGFIKAFKEYDLLAKWIPGYSMIYPALEMILGLMFLFNFYVNVAAWITAGIMLVGGIGVGIKISKKEKFQCACLGTWINVPLTKITLLEDILMFGMAVILL